MKAKTTSLMITAMAALMLFASPLMAEQGEPLVSVVRVELGITTSVGYPAPPEAIREKIEYTIEQVGRKALQGKPLSSAEEIKPDLAPILEKIFNQVLSGYEVSTLDIGIGEESIIRLEIKPIGSQAGGLEIITQFEGGSHPLWENLLKPQLETVSEKTKNMLAGVPSAAGSWAANAIEPAIEDLVPFEQLFPGFEVVPVLKISDRSTLTLTLRADKRSTIRLANLKIRSSTIPSLALEHLKYDAASRLDVLIGLPILFAQVHKTEIADEISSYLSESEIAKTLRLEPIVKIQPGSTTRVTIIAESIRYSAFVRGNVGIGKDVRNPEIEAHAGIFTAKKFELFTELNFLPGPIDLTSSVGAGFKITPNLYAAFGRNFVDGINRVWANAYLTEDIVLFFKKGVDEDKEKDTEFGITFKAHEFFSFGIAADFNNDVWFALTTNL